MESSRSQVISVGPERNGAVEETKHTYYHYRLARPVICTINFRAFITQGDLRAKVVPVKCGEGHKFTQEGVIQVPIEFDPQNNTHFNKVKVQYKPSSSVDFEKAALKARIKVYFRGFPLQTPVEEITSYFSFYGKIEYLYLMGPTKSKSSQRSIQGYVIFTSNDCAHNVLADVKSLYFGSSKLFCEIYQTRKKKKTSQNAEMKPSSQGMDNSVADQNQPHVSEKIKDRQSRLPVFNNCEMENMAMQGSFQHSFSQFQRANSDKTTGITRPFLKQCQLVKLNSADEMNVRFNIRKKRASWTPYMAGHFAL